MQLPSACDRANTVVLAGNVPAEVLYSYFEREKVVAARFESHCSPVSSVSKNAAHPGSDRSRERTALLSNRCMRSVAPVVSLSALRSSRVPLPSLSLPPHGASACLGSDEQRQTQKRGSPVVCPNGRRRKTCQPALTCSSSGSALRLEGRNKEINEECSALREVYEGDGLPRMILFFSPSRSCPGMSKRASSSRSFPWQQAFQTARRDWGGGKGGEGCSVAFLYFRAGFLRCWRRPLSFRARAFCARTHPPSPLY